MNEMRNGRETDKVEPAGNDGAAKKFLREKNMLANSQKESPDRATEPARMAAPDKMTGPEQPAKSEWATKDYLQREPANDRLHKAGEVARDEVKEHKSSVGGRFSETVKLQGRMGEELAAMNMPNSVNMNDVTGRTNFPNYDVVSQTEIASVKTYNWQRNNTLSGNYDKAFADIANPESKSQQTAADAFMKMQRDSPEKWQQLSNHLPPEVAQARNKQEMAQALSDKSSLRISKDQMKDACTNIEARINKNPAKYGLDPKLDAATRAEHAREMVQNKIKPIDNEITADQINTRSEYIVMHRHQSEGRPMDDWSEFCKQRKPNQPDLVQS